jgi:hypothetical protein
MGHRWLPSLATLAPFLYPDKVVSQDSGTLQLFTDWHFHVASGIYKAGSKEEISSKSCEGPNFAAWTASQRWKSSVKTCSSLHRSHFGAGQADGDGQVTALRTAMKAKTMSAKRREREKQVTEMPELCGVSSIFHFYFFSGGLPITSAAMMMRATCTSF